jgi:cell wall assembly regulator SMI1
MRELQWLEPGDRLTSEELARVQAQLGVFLPADYSDLVMKHDGASNPRESEFAYADRGRTRIGNFGALLSVRQVRGENVFATLNDLGEQLPQGIIPVVATGSGDFICFDYRAGKPSVVYFAHERVGEDAILQLAPTFGEFLDSLRAPVDE